MFPHFQSIIAGLKEGVSASFPGGNIIGIFKYLAEEKKNAAIEVVKFFISREYQRNTFKGKKYPVAYIDLLKDEEVHKNESCELIKKIQLEDESDFISEGPKRL